MKLKQTKENAISALGKKQFFKLVCGASLTDVSMVENLSFVYSLAGVHVIDLAPSADVIFAAERGIERALKYSSVHQYISTSAHPLIMASLQLDKDPHFRKAKVNYDVCDLCNACVKICPTEAFAIERTGETAMGRIGEERAGGLIYKIERCFGCGICPEYCHVDAISMVDTKPTPKETLGEMISLGVKSVEFHFGKNFYVIEEMWNEIKNLVNRFELISFSIGSKLLNDDEIKKAANLCYKLAGKDIILQCDGSPMSGAIDKLLRNGNNGDNLSFHVAEIIEREKLPVYLQISGGTNQNSYMKAIDSGIKINGIAVGSYARKLLMPYLNNLEDEEVLNEAIQKAKSLVDSVKKTIEMIK
ncbi:MAG: hypothetical protein A3B68_01860 [Candidatus Melainabacteria bacterium RIFCSPHIGHO2_02_FULL_34_12]|nr:MAG: hypothetical protein A3B68_01860 [Candidatus Melainabacteria bacterium RIFCSPHIGHO2_02_FULL_34_12]